MKKKKRKPRLVQYVPSEGPEPMFAEINPQPNKNYWRITIADIICGDRPVFLCRIPKSKKAITYTPREIAIAGATECTNGEGTIVVQEYRDNIPVFTSVWPSRAGVVVCIKSSDHEKAEPIVMPSMAEIRRKLKEKRAQKRPKRTIVHARKK